MSWPSEPEAFRAWFCDWLEANAPKPLWGFASTPFQGHWGGKDADFESEELRAWYQVALPLGFTAPGWPTEYGGAGMDPELVRVFREELARRQLPLPLVGLGLTMVGPIILAHGSPEQKAEHLPKIVRGEVRWCQGYSEPGAGSDLANLRTKAVLDGDEYVVDGQKIWTSHAEVSDWIFCLVRTSSEGRKQQGITFLLIDMATPGITTRTIELISGASPFCEVFFEGVRAPASNVVGEVGNGWRVAKALLAHERSMVGESLAVGGARLPVLRGYTVKDHAVAACGLGPDGRLADPMLRRDVIDVEMQQEAVRMTVRRINDAIRAGDQPGAESSILKLAGTELNQTRWELGVRIAGQAGLGWQGDEYSERDKALTKQWLRSRANTIEGGSNEVQRNIIARRVLNLPKGG